MLAYDDFATVTIGSSPEHNSKTPQPTTFGSYGPTSLQNKEKRFKAGKRQSQQVPSGVEDLRKSMDAAIQSSSPFGKVMPTRFSVFTRDDDN